MTFSAKIYWKIRNLIEYLVILYSQTDNTGVFSHREDNRDKEYVMTGVELARDFLPPINYWFDQEALNICVFASRIMGMSQQEGIRFSVRFWVKLAKKLGMITGNGFSYLRAGNELAYKYGALPYELMPDEINGMSWPEYSDWIPADDKLLEIAKNFKVSAYWRIKNTRQAMDAVRAGFKLFTGSTWFSKDFVPDPPLYRLTHTGQKVGAHAYYGDGDRNYCDDVRTPGTFGFEFGDTGVAWIDNLFGKHQLPVYVQAKLPQSSHDYYKQFILKS